MCLTAAGEVFTWGEGRYVTIPEHLPHMAAPSLYGRYVVFTAVAFVATALAAAAIDSTKEHAS